MANIGNIAATLSLNARDWSRNLKGAEKGLKGFIRRSGRSLIRFAKRASFYLSIIGGVGLAGFITQFSKFEEAMRNVNTIAEQSEKQFLLTSRAVREMAKEFGRMPIGLAEALYDINSASFTAARGLKVLRAATLAGRAGLSTTREAARAITGALNAYAMSADHAKDFSDTMFQTVKFGVLTFGELSHSLGIAVSTAAAAKVPFDQLAAAAATMTRGGINVREAFTALNRVMLRIIQNRGALGEVFALTAEGTGAAMMKVRGLAGTMKFLEEVTKGDTEAMIALSFMVRDLKAALSLTRNEGRDYARDIGRIANRTKRAGATMAAFKEQTKALSFQFALLKSAMMSFLIVVGRLIAPLFRLIYQDITALIGRFEKWVQTIKFTKKDWVDLYTKVRKAASYTIIKITFGLLMMASVTEKLFNRMIVLVLKFKLELNELLFWTKRFFKILSAEMLVERKGPLGGLPGAISETFRQIALEQKLIEKPIHIRFVPGGAEFLRRQADALKEINIREKNLKGILSGIADLREREIKALAKAAAWSANIEATNKKRVKTEDVLLWYKKRGKQLVEMEMTARKLQEKSQRLFKGGREMTGERQIKVWKEAGKVALRAQKLHKVALSEAKLRLRIALKNIRFAKEERNRPAWESFTKQAELARKDIETITGISKKKAPVTKEFMNIGAETIERGTVAAFRAERGLKDPTDKAAETTASNTTKLVEEMKDIAKALSVKEAVFQ